MKKSVARGLAWDPGTEHGHALAWRQSAGEHVDYGGLDKLRRSHPPGAMIIGYLPSLLVPAPI